MARIVLGAYMVQFPMGGMLSSRLQWLVGLKRLGHEVFIVEKASHRGSCFDPSKNLMTDDCSYGLGIVNALFSRFGLQESWCFVDSAGRYHGLCRERLMSAFKSADLFVGGAHEAWLEEAEHARLRVLVDGDPAFSQIALEERRRAGKSLPNYDYYYSVGRNVGTDRSTAPTAGVPWRPMFHPLVVDLFPVQPPDSRAPFTTVMNWQSFKTVQFEGKTYGHKNTEFMKFVSLPRLTKNVAIEAAVAGHHMPLEDLRNAGWRIRNAHEVTISYDSFGDYIRGSRGEFSVCKQGFVVTNSAWFGDRNSAYLASGRPVVLQETGFSAHLPCGLGLFAVRTPEEAADAIETIVGDYDRHARAAREIAYEHLSAERVLGEFLRELGI